MGIEGMALSKEARALGFPIVHKHKLSRLRQELIDAFVESRYMMFIKYAAVQLQQLGLKKQMDMFQKPEQKLEAIKSSPGDKEDNDSGDSNKSKEESDKPEMEEEEAKKIVESLTDSITSGEKKD